MIDLEMSEQRFISSVRPLIWFSKSCGLFPFNFSVENDKTAAEISKLGFFYCFCLIILILFSRLTFFPMIIDDPMAYKVFKTSYVLVASFYAVSTISYYIHFKKAKKVYEQLISFSKFVKVKHFHKKTFWFLIGLFSYYFGTYILSFVVYYYEAPDDFHSCLFPLSIIEMFFSMFIFVIFNIQFSTILLYLTLLLRSINTELIRIIKTRAEEDIYKLMQFHDKICGLCENVNRIYGMSILIYTIFTFVHIVLPFYYTVVMKKGYVMFVLWFTYQASGKWLLLFSCESVVAEVRKSSSIKIRGTETCTGQVN